MPLYGLLVVHILRIIRRNNCDRLLKAFYKACIMDWDVAVALLSADFSSVTWAQVQHSVAMVRAILQFLSSTELSKSFGYTFNSNYNRYHLHIRAGRFCFHQFLSQRGGLRN